MRKVPRVDVLCACGCGELVTWNHGKPHKFVRGHHARGEFNHNWGKHLEDKTREKISSSVRSSQTVRGSHWIGRKHSDATKAKISKAKTGVVTTPRNGILLTCTYCGNQYYKPRSREATSVYCSTDCRDVDYKTRYSGKGNPFKGRRHSEATVEKCRAGALAQASSRCQLPTIPEKAVHEELRRRGIEFQSEVPLGHWRVDVLIPSILTVIFIDGCYWHACPEHFPTRRGPVGDKGRIPYLKRLGYRVEILWEHSISEDVEAAVSGAIS